MFKSIDIDGSGSVSLDEFKADMEYYRMDIDLLLAENDARRKEEQEKDDLNKNRLLNTFIDSGLVNEDQLR